MSSFVFSSFLFNELPSSSQKKNTAVLFFSPKFREYFIRGQIASHHTHRTAVYIFKLMAQILDATTGYGIYFCVCMMYIKNSVWIYASIQATNRLSVWFRGLYLDPRFEIRYWSLPIAVLGTFEAFQSSLVWLLWLIFKVKLTDGWRWESSSLNVKFLFILSIYQ